jgi:2-dehydropantoate 2-reductase
MKIAIMGSGGVGGYFGARLAQGGSDVTFIARGAHLAAMREHGLRIESAAGDLHLPRVQATDDPASIGPVDLVVFAVKLFDTEAAARAIRPLVGLGTGVIPFQNGVQARELLQRELGEAPVLGGVAYIGAVIREPGVIQHIGNMHRLVFGEFDGRRSARAEAFLAACQRGGFDAELADDILLRIWQKFVLLVGVSGSTTSMRTTMGPIRAHPLTRAFLLELMQETTAVGRALGVALPPDYGQDRLGFVDGFPPEMTSSMHQDLKRGKPLELMWLSGAVADLGAQAGVPTPANRAVRDILALHAAGHTT